MEDEIIFFRHNVFELIDSYAYPEIDYPLESFESIFTKILLYVLRRGNNDQILDVLCGMYGFENNYIRTKYIDIIVKHFHLLQDCDEEIWGEILFDAFDKVIELKININDGMFKFIFEAYMDDYRFPSLAKSYPTKFFKQFNYDYALDEMYINDEIINIAISTNVDEKIIRELIKFKN